MLTFVTGGTPEMQREFLDSVSTDGLNSRRPLDRAKKPPIANQFALGYTYQDVLDADHEGAHTHTDLSITEASANST